LENARAKDGLCQPPAGKQEAALCLQIREEKATLRSGNKPDLKQFFETEAFRFTGIYELLSLTKQALEPVLLKVLNK
jgi:hypothetical protein